MFGKIIGRGSYGTVFELISHGKTYAAKLFDEKLHATREYMIASALGSPYTIKPVGFIYNEDVKMFGIVYSLYRRTLYDLINTTESFTETTKLNIMTRILRGIHMMHLRGMVHADLTFHNILLNDVDDLVIADYSITQFEHYSMSYNIQSLHIRAPEVFYDQQHLQSRKTAVNPSAIDMWSIGIIWLCLELGWIPFDKISDTREMCVWIQYIPSQLRAISYSPHRDIIANLLSHDPAQRFSAEQCLTLLGAEPPHVDLKQFDTMDWSITTKRLEHRSELYQKFANICERFGATVDIFGTCMLIIEHIMKKYITFNPDTHGVAICVIVTHLLGEEGKFLHKMTSPDNIQLVNDLDPDTIVELIPGISHGLPFNRYIYTDIFSDEFKKNLILNCPIWHASDTHLALAIDTKLANKITEQVEQLRAGIHSPSVMTENIESMVYSTNRLCDESVYIEA